MSSCASFGCLWLAWAVFGLPLGVTLVRRWGSLSSTLNVVCVCVCVLWWLFSCFSYVFHSFSGHGRKFLDHSGWCQGLV